MPTLKASCTNTMARFTVGTCARKTGAEKAREKRVGVWSFCGAFLFEKRYKSKQLFHVEAVATAKGLASIYFMMDLKKEISVYHLILHVLLFQPYGYGKQFHDFM